jgi:hypothetical protein
MSGIVFIMIFYFFKLNPIQLILDMKYRFNALFACFLLSALLLTFTAGSNVLAQNSSTVAEITVDTGGSTYLNAPLSVSLQGVHLQLHEGDLQLYELSGGNESEVASQLKPGNPDQLVWILDGETGPNTVRQYELRVVDQAETPANSSKVKVEDDGNSLLFTIEDKPVLNYRYTEVDVPEGVDEIFKRGGYIHPIWSPGGEVLSRIQPPDHYHHYGIWNPWTRTEFEGREVDFWNLGSGQGTVQAKQIAERKSGRVYGGFRAVHDHIDFTGPAGEKIAINEQWEVDIWNVDPEQNVWMIDFTSTLNPATEDGITIKEYRYQGFSLRATEKWNDNNTDILTSEGFDKSDANATRARWIDVNGISDVTEGTSGILFMTNPANFNYPEQLRIWPVGANNGIENVYINFNPAQDRDWNLEPGSSYALKYRMFVYDGTISEDEANLYWNNFAQPPKIEINPVR